MAVLWRVVLWTKKALLHLQNFPRTLLSLERSIRSCKRVSNVTICGKSVAYSIALHLSQTLPPATPRSDQSAILPQPTFKHVQPHVCGVSKYGDSSTWSKLISNDLFVISVLELGQVVINLVIRYYYLNKLIMHSLIVAFAAHWGSFMRILDAVSSARGLGAESEPTCRYEMKHWRISSTSEGT